MCIIEPYNLNHMCNIEALRSHVAGSAAEGERFLVLFAGAEVGDFDDALAVY